MKFLHTSDWHLGRSLYGRKRYDEFSAFLDWLAGTLEKEAIDALLIAGDIFDTTTPGNKAQELYYRFLCRVSTGYCQHIVIIAGNHDSPSFLNAPKELLKALNVHVVGAKTEKLEDEIIEIINYRKDKKNSGNGFLDFGEDFSAQDNSTVNPQDSAIICAVPYLRDKDIRTAEPGEMIDDKNRKLAEGIKNHYFDIVNLGEEKQKEYHRQSSIKNHQSKIPIIALGHLFTSGGKTVDGDGVRDLYVGSLAQVNEDSFPSSIDYLALGHLHVPQKVGGKEHIRYSGSPIPMGFGEANQQKQVVIVEFKNQKTEIKTLPVPCFQELISISGDLNEIQEKLKTLKDEKSSAWLEIEYNGDELTGNLRELIEEAIDGSDLEIRRIKNRQIINRTISRISDEETLDKLDPSDVFARCLETHEIPEENRKKLTESYNEILRDIYEEDWQNF